jgi:hypothetical protein
MSVGAWLVARSRDLGALDEEPPLLDGDEPDPALLRGQRPVVIGEPADHLGEPVAGRALAQVQEQRRGVGNPHGGKTLDGGGLRGDLHPGDIAADVQQRDDVAAHPVEGMDHGGLQRLAPALNDG